MSKEAMMYGGQAVVRGVMMRSPRYFSVSCRRDDGTIQTTVEHIDFPQRANIFRLPFIRGAFALVDAMRLGAKALFWSAKVVGEDLEGSATPSGAPAGKVSDIALGGALVTGLGIGVFLFFVLPSLLAATIKNFSDSRIVLNLAEAVFKLGIFLTYITLVGRMKNIKEVFQYHGAEHRAINTFEAGKPLNLESTRDFGTLHVRCGTNFILIVLFVSIAVFTFVPWDSVIERIGIRLVCLPLIAGIAYEIIRIAGRNAEKPWVTRLLAPGLLLQNITTRPPSDDQVEVALTALNAVIQAEETGLEQAA